MVEELEALLLFFVRVEARSPHRGLRSCDSLAQSGRRVDGGLFCDVFRVGGTGRLLLTQRARWAFV